MRRPLAILLSGLALILSACASAAAPAEEAGQSRATAQLTGTVAWRERIMLPANSVLIVSLQDVSLADAPAKLMSAQRQEGSFSPPVPFVLRYDPAKIIPNHRYSVSARIEVDGKLRFASDTAYPVLTNGAPVNVDLLVVGVPD
jgi:putative lipoprotein